MVTRLVNNLGLLENANVTFIDTPRQILGYTFFNKAHMLKKGKWKHSRCTKATPTSMNC
jgi:hypothetical protein